MASRRSIVRLCALLGVVLAASGCDLLESGGDAGTADAHSSVDAGTTDLPQDDAGDDVDDAGPDDPSSDDDAGAPNTGPTDGGASDSGAGDAGTSDAGDPTAVDCPVGFLLTTQGCRPDAPEPFLSRSDDDVCARWQTDHQGVFPEWEALAPDDSCDPGVVPAAALENALLRTNLYRWLAGSDPIVLDADRYDTQQACAVIQAAQGGLDHHPPQSAPCYTPEGAAGAGSSNLSGGAGLAGSVDLYVGDNGVSSLGHRRWVLNPSATTTQFGHKNSFSCMYSFSNNGAANPAFVAWPPPGYVPESAARGTFSFSSTTRLATADTVIEIAIDDGAFAPVSFTNLGWGYGWGETLSFSPPGNLWQLWSGGTTLRVRVRNTSAGDVSWTTHFVACE